MFAHLADGSPIILQRNSMLLLANARIDAVMQPSIVAIR
jgi:hypothetical protein